MLTFRELKSGLNELRLHGRPVIAHTSLKSFGLVPGGPQTVMGALLTAVDGLVMPTFTYKTMVTPEVGPPHNGIKYGSGRDSNQMSEIFSPAMPADKMMGILPEILLLHPQVRRTRHPILSFGGINADEYLAAQTLFDPFAPIGALAKNNGWLLLMGVNHTVNTSIHFAEKLAGRKQFIRWALTKDGVRECPSWPGCSLGFDAIASDLQSATRSTQIGDAHIQAVPLWALFEIVMEKVKQDPLALLCQQEDCGRCNAVREQFLNPDPLLT